MNGGLQTLMGALGHQFEDLDLIEAALVHRSYAAEHSGVEDNERLEFFGDAVLQLIVTHYLFERHPALTEGQMAKVRAACVNRDELATIARSIDLGAHLKMGAGEEASGGRSKPSILSDAMEAVLAAVFLDGGIEAATSVVLRHWRELIDGKAASPGRKDYKTRLQEVLAAEGKRPGYTVAGAGPDHDREFTAEVIVEGQVRGTGSGKSKKEAEQQAARAALDAID